MKSKELWIKGPEWNNAAYEEKEKSYYFKHPAQDTTNSHPHFKQRERMGTWEKKRPKSGARKSKQRIKTGGMLKESKLVKLN